MVRCYDIAYLCFARDQWEAAEKQDPAHLYDLVKAGLTSEAYKNHWLPKVINLSDQKAAVTVDQRLGMLGDKLRLLQMAGNQEDPADIKAIIDQLAYAAAMSGIAPRPLLDSLHPVSHASILPRHHTHHLNSFHNREGIGTLLTCNLPASVSRT
jgi:hypothetical protein